MIPATLSLALLLAQAAETSVPTPVPALAPAALPADYREALQQLDADSLSASAIGEKLTALSALQTPTCRDTLHRQIAEARHPIATCPCSVPSPAPLLSVWSWPIIRPAPKTSPSP